MDLPAFTALSLIQRRILGVLIEKQKTTPDVYPMSLNAIVTGCNQKSNRDPVMMVDDVEVEETLAGLQKLALATRVDSGRVEKWRHFLYETWNVGKVEIAVLAELLLRGQQTEAELRTRVSRMEPLDDLDALRAVLQPLVQRGLVVYLGPEGRRGTMLTHGFHEAPELERIRNHAPAIVRPEPPPAADNALKQVQSDLADLRRQIEELRIEVRSLRPTI